MNSIFILAAASSAAEKLGDRIIGFAGLLGLLWVALFVLHMFNPYMSDRTATGFTAVTSGLITLLLFLYSVISISVYGLPSLLYGIFPTLLMFGISARMFGRVIEYCGNFSLAETWLALGKKCIYFACLGIIALIITIVRMAKIF